MLDIIFCFLPFPLAIMESGCLCVFIVLLQWVELMWGFARFETGISMVKYGGGI